MWGVAMDVPEMVFCVRGQMGQRSASTMAEG